MCVCVCVSEQLLECFQFVCFVLLVECKGKHRERAKKTEEMKEKGTAARALRILGHSTIFSLFHIPIFSSR